MIDLISATASAVFAALNAAIDPATALVTQHVLENQEPPLIIIGAIDSENQAGKGEQFERIVLEVQSIYRGEGRAPLLVMMAEIRSALDGQPIVAAGVSLAAPRYLTASASDVAADGVTYAGITQFEIYAEPA
jgi:hypothetical protein